MHVEDSRASLEWADAEQLDTTIVIPTYNEGQNVQLLVRRLAAAFSGRAAEVLFVDDSVDDTPQIIRDVALTSAIPVRMIHRTGQHRVGGLAGAVTTGVRSSRATYVVVMDGDLQHPPEMAPRLRDAAESADLAVASRYMEQGNTDGLAKAYRRLVSSGSTALAKACFPRRVGRVCTDPMTGFFCFRRDAVDLDRLRPRGFKILLEILTRHDLEVVELPFAFGARHSGESKADWRNGLHFCRQLLSLRMGRMSRFATVGLVGTVLNLGLMALLIHGHAAHYLLASAVAAEVSILSNFVMQERLVFRDMTDGIHARSRRFLTALVYNNAEAVLRLPFLALLVQVVGMGAILAQALALAIAFVARFLFMSRVVYRPVRAPWDLRSTGFVESPPVDALDAA